MKLEISYKNKFNKVFDKVFLENPVGARVTEVALYGIALLFAYGAYHDEYISSKILHGIVSGYSALGGLAWELEHRRIKKASLTI